MLPSTAGLTTAVCCLFDAIFFANGMACSMPKRQLKWSANEMLRGTFIFLGFSSCFCVYGAFVCSCCCCCSAFFCCFCVCHSLIVRCGAATAADFLCYIFHVLVDDCAVVVAVVIVVSSVIAVLVVTRFVYSLCVRSFTSVVGPVGIRAFDFFFLVWLTFDLFHLYMR